MTLVAVHQPTFLPWLGWWDKFVRADVFVLLDDVQFPKKGGTWMNRVRILSNGSPTWLTVPVDRSYHGVRTVNEILVDSSKPWRDRILKTIATNYARAACFSDVYPIVEEVVRLPTDRVAELNEAGMRRIGETLGFDMGKLVHQSDLDWDGHGTDLLIRLCESAGGTAYLSGDGAGEYLEPAKFAAAGLELLEQNFIPPQHPQQAPQYVAGLSIVDALMNCGWEPTAELLSPRARRDV